MPELIFSAAALQLLSAAALAFSVLIYVLLDGTDLGVGMLYAFNRAEADRQVMTLSLLPVWDGNETWLVLGGGGLLALFPAAYAILLSALYLPVFLMLLALIARGMAIEYRDRADPQKRWRFDLMLMGGSALAAAGQGVIMGTFIQGIPHDGAHYTGGGWEWLGVFPLFCGLALMAGYALLGACWLIWRTEGMLQARARALARRLGPLALALVALLTLWTCGLHEEYRRHLSDLRFTLPAALLLLAVAGGFRRALSARVALLPLCLALGGVVLTFALLLLAVYPAMIPPRLSISAASSPPLSQGFVLIGFAVLIPITLAYNTFGFWVFRGKIHAQAKGPLSGK
ncbi:cytochrome d ubiquinol oxidase subunit II [Sodalis sp. RH22]|uniref:cytochrome d ubiquinol oxidase subunit II n=1 Tax=unclassified Sodalis (in: enterobacteria) TaxID=2636512 RepID=UPI0039B58ECE